MGKNLTDQAGGFSSACGYPDDLFRNLLAGNPDPILCVDYTGTVLYANESSFAVINMPGGRLPEPLEAGFRAAIKTGIRQRVALKCGQRNYLFEIIPCPRQEVANIYGKETSADRQADFEIQLKRSKREKEELQAQLLHAQKLEAAGTLASGVAHDFNNILTIINAYVDICMTKAGSTDDINYFLKKIYGASKKAAGIIRQLQLFSRKGPMALSVFSCNDTVKNLLKMLNRLIEESIVIETAMEPGPWMVHADEGAVEQVIMNLALNGRDAMPFGGKMVIKTTNATIDESCCRRNSESRPGKFVSLSITDTGTGIDKDVLPHIFEPFFSTKPEGKGTGLGLSVAYGIVKQHHGWIEVESELNKGSAFTVYLPAFFGQVQEKTRDLPKPEEKLLGKGERVLFVEDDNEVRKMSAEMLRQSNYSVFTAKNAKRAWEIFHRENGKIDLIFCDMLLPDMPGIRLVEELAASGSSDFRVIFCTGYEDIQSVTLADPKRKCRFLRKPYSLDTLLETIKEILK